MPREVPGDPARDGASFIPSVVGHAEFRAAGVAHGRGTDCRWTVVDPERHPLYVWRRTLPTGRSYARTACTLDAAVFTNGPMMGKRLPQGRKVTRWSVPLEFATWAAVGTATGLGVARIAGTRGSWLLGGVAGGALAWRRTLTGWAPCGRVRGQANGIDDRRNFDDEGSGHAWFGRFGRDFSSYRIADGDLPSNVEEGVGGLILLVRDFMVVGKRTGDSSHCRDYAERAHKKGVVAWGLVPGEGLRRRTPTTHSAAGVGVLVVLGGHRLRAATAAAILGTIGTRDAVATDQGGSVLMGSGRECVLRPPSPPRQAIQLYGLCCG
jgi:hypothetical protein